MLVAAHAIWLMQLKLLEIVVADQECVSSSHFIDHMMFDETSMRVRVARGLPSWVADMARQVQCVKCMKGK